MPVLPTGTVTFLFTDIEGSTRRWEQHPEQMSAVLARHDYLLRRAIEVEGGFVFKTMGDAFYAAFPTPHQAVRAALQAQSALRDEEWEPATGAVRVRMALHTGVAEERDSDYFGQPVNRVARILSAGHGGQTLLSNVTHDLVRDALPPETHVLDLGAHRLKDLIRPEHIFQLDPPGSSLQFPPLRTLDNRPNNLPRQATPLIGREKEIAQVLAMLRDEHTTLVTLTGPGGTGKTRLALQVGADSLDDFPDGVWFVDLAPVLDTALIISTISQALGVREASSESLLETLKGYLKEKELLLVLDNFEQVAAAASLVGGLLLDCSRLKMLATSRVPLRIRGEKEYPVSPLSLPDCTNLPPLARLTQYDAVRLFIERATDIKPDFEVNNGNAPAVAEICIRLDGLPLAIELAAAQVRIFPPQALLARLDNMFKLLRGGAANLPARQQTLFSTIEWSYHLLNPREQQLFRRMSVFQGGCTIEALEVVCYSEGLQVEGQLAVDILDGVEALMAGSLLQQREGVGGEPRFWMLETMHKYARQKLHESGEAVKVQREHALYFVQLAEEAEPQIQGPHQVEWLDRLEEEHDNLRVVLQWVFEQVKEDGDAGARTAEAAEAAEVGLRMGAAIWRFWSVRGYLSEGREQLNRLLSLSIPSSTSPASFEGRPRLERAAVLNGAGYLAWGQSDRSAARSLFQDALEVAKQNSDTKNIALALNNLGLVAFEDGDYASARTLHEQSLMLREKLLDKGAIATSLHNLGCVLRAEAGYAAARALLEQSLTLQREVGNKRGIAYSDNVLGQWAFEDGDYASARTLHEQSLAIQRELRDKSGMAVALTDLANVAFMEGDSAAANSMHKESLLLIRETGNKTRIALRLAGLGETAVAGGYPQKGAILLAASEALAEAMDLTMSIGDYIPFDSALASANSQLGEEAFEKAQRDGRAMTVEQAIAYALEDNPGE